jgi:pimeloyl-ACP methyl ester carboxylesterase
MSAAASSIVFESTGAGAPVVFIHGLGGTSNVWCAQVAALARHVTTIRLELPGSGRAAWDGALSTSDFVETTLALLRQLGVTEAHFVGHSYGAIICQHLAARAPYAVRSLALIGPLRAPPEAARPALRDRAARARAEGMVGIADATVQMGTSADTKQHRPEVAGFVRELVMRQPPEGYALTCEALAATEAADLSALRVPALVVSGDEDATAPPAAAGAVAAALAGAQFQILGRCGHWTPLERAAEVTDALTNFLLARTA